jgi:hypothetical protein
MKSSFGNCCTLPQYLSFGWPLPAASSEAANHLCAWCAVQVSTKWELLRAHSLPGIFIE